jgi:anti-anti-sigma factor
LVNFTFDSATGALHCTFAPRLDTVASDKIAPLFFSELASQAANGPVNVVFDLSRVGFIASAFLRICIKAAKSPEVREFSIANCTPEAKKIFKIGGLESLFAVS